MSMEHKAFVFDCEEYSIELEKILTNSLLNNETTFLISFIEQNLENIKDPYEGEPLELSWKTAISPSVRRCAIDFQDVDEVGDFALTKFDDPTNDIGLGNEWHNTKRVLNQNFFLNTSNILLGECIGVPDFYFDPGKMGSYLQSPTEVKSNLKLIHNYLKEQPKSIIFLQDIKLMFKKAINEEKGLYITF